MSTKQLKNRVENQFVSRESNHIFISTAFFILVFIVSIIFIVASSLNGSIFVLVPFILVAIFSVIKIAIQIKYIFAFRKLISSIDDDSIGFYITKSWNRKREATIWFSAIGIIIMAIPLLWTIIVQPEQFIFDLCSLFISILLIIIIAYLNIQNLESNLKLSERKMDMNSMEWNQIKKETRIFYRLMFIYFLSTITILPLLFLIIPAYRNWLYKIVKN